MASVNLIVYSNEYLQKPYQLLKVDPTKVAQVSNGRPTIDQCVPISLVAAELQLHIFPSKGSNPAAHIYSSDDGFIVFDNDAEGIWHYFIPDTEWAARGYLNKDLEYSLVLIRSSIPKRLWGGTFSVLPG